MNQESKQQNNSPPLIIFTSDQPAMGGENQHFKGEKMRRRRSPYLRRSLGEILSLGAWEEDDRR